MTPAPTNQVTTPGSILDACIIDAASRYKQRGIDLDAMDILDLMFWYQAWSDLNEKRFATVVTMRNHPMNHLHYVYRDIEFLYEIAGRVTVDFYNAISSRNLPSTPETLTD